MTDMMATSSNGREERTEFRCSPKRPKIIVVVNNSEIRLLILLLLTLLPPLPIFSPTTARLIIQNVVVS